MSKRIAPKVAILSTGDEPNDDVLIMLDGHQYWWGTRKQAGCPTMFGDLIWGFAQFLQDTYGHGDGVAPVVKVTLPLDFMTNGSMPEGYESEQRWEEGGTPDSWDCEDAQVWFNHHWVPLHGVEVPTALKLVREEPPLYHDGEDYVVFVVVTVDVDDNCYHCYQGHYSTPAEADAFREGLHTAVDEDGLWAEGVTKERYDEVQTILGLHE